MQAGFLHEFNSYGISGQIFGLNMESLHNNIQLMLEFLKAPFLVLHFSYYTMTHFLLVLSVIWLSMLMILPSTLIVTRPTTRTTRIGLWTWIWFTRHWWLDNRSGLLISMMEKFSWVFFWPVYQHGWYWSENGLFYSLGKNILLDAGLTFSSKLDWGSSIISCWNCLEEYWSLDSFHEVSFSWGCSVSL